MSLQNTTQTVSSKMPIDLHNQLVNIKEDSKWSRTLIFEDGVLRGASLYESLREFICSLFGFRNLTDQNLIEYKAIQLIESAENQITTQADLELIAVLANRAGLTHNNDKEHAELSYLINTLTKKIIPLKDKIPTLERNNEKLEEQLSIRFYKRHVNELLQFQDLLKEKIQAATYIPKPPIVQPQIKENRQDIAEEGKKQDTATTSQEDAEQQHDQPQPFDQPTQQRNPQSLQPLRVKKIKKPQTKTNKGNQPAGQTSKVPAKENPTEIPANNNQLNPSKITNEEPTQLKKVELTEQPPLKEASSVIVQPEEAFIPAEIENPPKIEVPVSEQPTQEETSSAIEEPIEPFIPAEIENPPKVEVPVSEQPAQEETSSAIEEPVEPFIPVEIETPPIDLTFENTQEGKWSTVKTIGMVALAGITLVGIGLLGALIAYQPKPINTRDPLERQNKPIFQKSGETPSRHFFLLKNEINLTSVTTQRDYFSLSKPKPNTPEYNWHKPKETVNIPEKEPEPDVSSQQREINADSNAFIPPDENNTNELKEADHNVAEKQTNEETPIAEILPENTQAFLLGEQEEIHKNENKQLKDERSEDEQATEELRSSNELTNTVNVAPTEELYEANPLTADKETNEETPIAEILPENPQAHFIDEEEEIHENEKKQLENERLEDEQAAEELRSSSSERTHTINVTVDSSEEIKNPQSDSKTQISNEPKPGNHSESFFVTANQIKYAVGAVFTVLFAYVAIPRMFTSSNPTLNDKLRDFNPTIEESRDPIKAAKNLIDAFKQKNIYAVARHFQWSFFTFRDKDEHINSVVNSFFEHLIDSSDSASDKEIKERLTFLCSMKTKIHKHLKDKNEDFAQDFIGIIDKKISTDSEWGEFYSELLKTHESEELAENIEARRLAREIILERGLQSSPTREEKESQFAKSALFTIRSLKSMSAKNLANQQTTQSFLETPQQKNQPLSERKFFGEVFPSSDNENLIFQFAEIQISDPGDRAEILENYTKSILSSESATSKDKDIEKKLNHLKEIHFQIEKDFKKNPTIASSANKFLESVDKNIKADDTWGKHYENLLRQQSPEKIPQIPVQTPSIQTPAKPIIAKAITPQIPKPTIAPITATPSQAKVDFLKNSLEKCKREPKNLQHRQKFIEEIALLKDDTASLDAFAKRLLTSNVQPKYKQKLDIRENISMFYEILKLDTLNKAKDAFEHIEKEIDVLTKTDLELSVFCKNQRNKTTDTVQVSDVHREKLLAEKVIPDETAKLKSTIKDKKEALIKIENLPAVKFKNKYIEFTQTHPLSQVEGVKKNLIKELKELENKPEEFRLLITTSTFIDIATNLQMKTTLATSLSAKQFEILAQEALAACHTNRLLTTAFTIILSHTDPSDPLLRKKLTSAANTGLPGELEKELSIKLSPQVIQSEVIRSSISSQHTTAKTKFLSTNQIQNSKLEIINNCKSLYTMEKEFLNNITVLMDLYNYICKNKQEIFNKINPNNQNEQSNFTKLTSLHETILSNLTKIQTSSKLKIDNMFRHLSYENANNLMLVKINDAKSILSCLNPNESLFLSPLIRPIFSDLKIDAIDALIMQEEITHENILVIRRLIEENLKEVHKANNKALFDFVAAISQDYDSPTHIALVDLSVAMQLLPQSLAPSEWKNFTNLFVEKKSTKAYTRLKEEKNATIQAAFAPIKDHYKELSLLLDPLLITLKNAPKKVKVNSNLIQDIEKFSIIIKQRNTELSSKIENSKTVSPPSEPEPLRITDTGS